MTSSEVLNAPWYKTAWKFLITAGQAIVLLGGLILTAEDLLPDTAFKWLVGVLAVTNAALVYLKSNAPTPAQVAAVQALVGQPPRKDETKPFTTGL